MSVAVGERSWLSSLRLISHEEQPIREPVESIRQGTGWFERHGFVVTNAHVVSGASKIEVKLSDGRAFGAQLVVADSVNDLALLSVEGADLPAGLVVSERAVGLAEDIVLLGYPLTHILGESIKVGRGSVSSLTGLGDDVTRIQIDAPVHPGNSGGPVLSNRGEVVGVVVSRLRDGALVRDAGVIAQNLNYAIKASYVRALVDNASAGGPARVIDLRSAVSVAEIVQKAQAAVVQVRCVAPR